MLSHLIKKEERGAQCSAFDIYCCWRRYTANFWSVSRERKHLGNVRSYLNVKYYPDFYREGKHFYIVKSYLNVNSYTDVYREIYRSTVSTDGFHTSASLSNNPKIPTYYLIFAEMFTKEHKF